MKEIIKANTPSLIPIADKPLNEGGEIQYITNEQFIEKFGYEYGEGLPIAVI
jgi:hypothetical protein